MGSEASAAEETGAELRCQPRNFAALFDRHYPRVFRLALALLGNREDAEDAAALTFAEAWKSLPTFRGRSQITTWLHRIALRVCLYTKNRQPSCPSISGVQGLADTSTTDPSKGMVLARALQRLDPDHRSTVVLHELEGYTYREIAQILECPIGTVRSRLHYALRRLRALLEEELG